MLKLAVKIIVLCFFVLGSSVLISQFIYKPLQRVPYSYSSDVIHLKSSYLKNYSGKFNTVFIGSSHVYRQFHPLLFDSLTGKEKIRSFNYGVQGLGATELFYLSNHIVKDKIPLKYLLLEISTITFPDHLNLNTTRMFYWYNRGTYTFTIKALFDSKDNSLPEKFAMATMHTIGLLDKILNFGYINDLNTFYGRDRDVHNRMEIYNARYTGFAPRQRNYPLQRDIKGINLRRQASTEQYEKYEKNPQLLKNYNREYLAKINTVIERYAKEGIYTIFVFAPRADKESYNEIIPLFNQIDAKHKIDIADSRKYPEFYSLENSADETHLNKKGSGIFTTVLAAEFNKLIGSNQKLK